MGDFAPPNTTAVDEQTNTNLELFDFSGLLNTNPDIDEQPINDRHFPNFIGNDDPHGLDNFVFQAGILIGADNGHFDYLPQLSNFAGNSDLSAFDNSFNPGTNTVAEYTDQSGIGPHFPDFIGNNEDRGLDNLVHSDPVEDFNAYADTGLHHFNPPVNNNFNVVDNFLLPGTNITAGYTEQFDAILQPPLWNDNHSFIGFNNLTSTPNVALGTEPTPTTGTRSNITSPTSQPVAIRRTNVVAATPSINSSGGRLMCTYLGCAATFARPGDRDRHMGKHSPPQHSCPVNGCDRKGNKAFYRLDKLHDHQRQKHKMTV